ncbi:MAG: M1 family aminopeptidase [Thermodesulfovibrionales bacterium]
MNFIKTRTISRKFSGILFMVILSFSIIKGLEGQSNMAEETVRAYPEYDLSVSFDLKNNLVRGDAKINLFGPTEISLEGLRIANVSLNGKPIAAGPERGWLKINQKGTLEIRYEKAFTGALEANPLGEGALSGSMISDEGICLTGSWYPQVRGLAFYRLRALVPNGFQAISEADEITSVETPGGMLYSFNFPHPTQSIDLVAGNYVQVKASFGGMDIYTYLFPKDEALSGEFIEYTKKYLKMDDKRLIPYAYKRFSVVENIFPTGLSMPTFTLIGAEILRLPFVLNESLGHEITHQWFGNYVYADFETGNWLEAVTVYMADYRYAHSQGKGRQYRKKALIDYQSYVNSENDFPLRKFYERTGHSSEAIGYGKGMMLFNMLEKLVGKDVFYKSLRAFIKENRWRVATWDDIERVFEKESGKRLDWFFSQWLDRKGVPHLEVENAQFLLSKGVPTVSLDIAQRGKSYRLTLRVKILAGSKEIKRASILVDGPKQTFRWGVAEKPTGLVIDEDYEVMRGLSPDELPPVISRLLGSKKRIAVTRAAEKEKYESLLQALGQNGFALKDENDITDKDIRDSSLLVLGADSPIMRRLLGKVESPTAGFALTVRDNPLNAENVIAIVEASSREEVDLATPKIFHYGQYSTITFSAGKNTGKEMVASQNGIVRRISSPASAVVPHEGTRP